MPKIFCDSSKAVRASSVTSRRTNGRSHSNENQLKNLIEYYYYTAYTLAARPDDNFDMIR